MGVSPISEEPWKYWPFRLLALPGVGIQPGAAQGSLRRRGDSMEETILRDGDVLLVDTSIRPLRIN